MGDVHILGNPNYHKQEAVEQVLDRAAADPGSPVDGYIFVLEGGTNRVRVRIAGAWKNLAFTDDIVALGNDSIATANLQNNSVTFAKIQEMAAHTIFGNITGGQTEGTAIGKNDLITWLALTTDNLSDFAAEVATIIAATAIDAATLDGETVASLTTSIVDAISGGAGAAYDTLVEIQAFLTSQGGDISTLLTAMGNKNKAGVGPLNIGNGVLTDIPHAHGLGTTAVLPFLIIGATSKGPVLAPFTVTDNNTVTWNFNAAPSNNEYKSYVLPIGA